MFPLRNRAATNVLFCVRMKFLFQGVRMMNALFRFVERTLLQEDCCKTDSNGRG